MTTAVRVGNDRWELIKQDTVLSFYSVIYSVLSKIKLWRDLQFSLKTPVSKGLSNPVGKTFIGMSGRRFHTKIPLGNKVQTSKNEGA